MTELVSGFRLCAAMLCVSLASCTEPVPMPAVTADLVPLDEGRFGAASIEACNIEHVNGLEPATVDTVVIEGHLQIDGWLAGVLGEDGHFEAAPEAVLTPLDVATAPRVFPMSESVERRDVVSALGHSGLSAAGVRLDADVEDLADGRYSLQLRRGDFTCPQLVQMLRHGSGSALAR